MPEMLQKENNETGKDGEVVNPSSPRLGNTSIGNPSIDNLSLDNPSQGGPCLGRDFKRRWAKISSATQSNENNEESKEELKKESESEDVKDIQDANFSEKEDLITDTPKSEERPIGELKIKVTDKETKEIKTNGEEDKKSSSLHTKKRVSQNAFSAGKTNGNVNGLVNGKTNGRINGLKFRRKKEISWILARGLINGRINGLRRGLSNGNGLINGNGLVNGNGFVNGYINGRSFVNGRKFLYGEKSVKAFRVKKSVIFSLVAMIALALILVPYFAITGDNGISIDGDFSDWEDAIRFRDSTSDMDKNSDVNIEHVAIAYDEDSLSFLIDVKGRIFSGDVENGRKDAGLDTAYIFIDKDRDTKTGYEIGGLGADARIELIGWENNVRSTTFYKFDDSRSKEDWNGFYHVCSLPAICLGDKVETQVAYPLIGISSHKKVDFTVVIFDAEMNMDRLDYIASSSGGTLQVFQKWVAPSVCPAGSICKVMELEFYSSDADLEIKSLSFNLRGNADDSSFTESYLLGYPASPRDMSKDMLDEEVLSRASVQNGRLTFDFAGLHLLHVYKNSVLKLSLAVQISNNSKAGSTFSFCINNSDDVCRVDGKGGVTISDFEGSSYISSSPAGLVVDGKFDDWLGIKANYDEKGDAEGRYLGTKEFDCSAIDIMDYRLSIYEKDLFAYVRVDGKVLSGNEIPVIVTEDRKYYERTEIGNSEVSESSEVVLPELVGGDFLYILIDSDKNESTGMRFNMFHKGYDSMISVEGTRGRIISSKVLKYDEHAKAWETSSQTGAKAICDGSEIELSASLFDLGIIQNDFDALIYMSDWSSNMDVSDYTFSGNRTRFGSRAGTNVVLNEICPKPPSGDDWVELYNPTDNAISIGYWNISIYDSSNQLIYKYTIPSGTVLEPGEFYVAYIPASIPYKGGVILISNNGLVVDSVSYSTISPPFVSYARHYGDWDLNDPTAWFKSRTATPGEHNEAIPELGDIRVAIFFIAFVTLLFIKRSKRRTEKRKNVKGCPVRRMAKKNKGE